MISPKEEEENHGSRGQGHIPEVDSFFAFFYEERINPLPIGNNAARTLQTDLKNKRFIYYCEDEMDASLDSAT
ncbi:hypothetical protein M0802_007170 [Mischocyttarus mexicanus]|nr:hypothetical protein M0802_007170 [Mischocyttarus mexicanus]